MVNFVLSVYYKSNLQSIDRFLRRRFRFFSYSPDHVSFFVYFLSFCDDGDVFFSIWVCCVAFDQKLH